jgi:hypothetical protein
VLHAEREPLHGITVLLERTSGELLIGRFHETIERGVVLLDVAQLGPGGEAADRQAWVERTIRFGVKVDERRVVVPQAEVGSLVRLSDWRPEPS